MCDGCIGAVTRRSFVTAAGIGRYFLHMDAVEERGEGPRVVLPDDPW